MLVYQNQRPAAVDFKTQKSSTAASDLGTLWSQLDRCANSTLHYLTSKANLCISVHNCNCNSATERQVSRHLNPDFEQIPVQNLQSLRHKSIDIPGGAGIASPHKVCFWGEKPGSEAATQVGRFVSVVAPMVLEIVASARELYGSYLRTYQHRGRQVLR